MALTILPDDMYDAVPGLAGNIPRNAKYVAGYVDSISFTWPASLWAQFAGLHVTISTTGRVPAHVGDRETGDLSPQQVYDLYQAGKIRIVYCNFASWQAVQDVFNANHKPQPPYWIAEYPGGGRVLPVLNGITAVAHQYASTSQYDLSCVTDVFVSLVGGTVTDPQAVANAVLFNTKIVGPNGPTPYSLNDDTYWSNWYANQIPGIASAVAALSKQMTAALAAITAEDADMKALAAQESADHADTVTAIGKVSAIDPATLEPELKDALIAAGWTQAPTADQNAAATAPAVLALITSKLGGTA